MSALPESKKRAAFDIWTDAFDKYQVSPAEARNPFRNRWDDSPSELSDELTYTADILWALSNCLTEKSVPIFADKVRGLVRCRRENEYQMRLSELELGAILASRVSPIAFEPVVPLGADPARKPSSTDYSVLLPSGEVFIEATTIDLQKPPYDIEALLKRIVSKLVEKRRQAFRDRVYLLAVKVLGPPKTFPIAKQLINERVWPNPKFRRYGGIFGYVETPNELGQLKGMWLPNDRSIAPPATDIHDLFNGRRCFHLDRVKSLKCSTDEVAALRRRAMLPETVSAIHVPVRLTGGPLDGIETLLWPTRAGDGHIGIAWEFEGRATIRGFDLAIPPHGPIQISYRRQSDTWYEFAQFRVWINELRPSVRRNEFLLRLSLCA